jgi:hypothetical protein
MRMEKRKKHSDPPLCKHPFIWRKKNVSNHLKEIDLKTIKQIEK